jgi:hypothetical protein
LRQAFVAKVRLSPKAFQCEEGDIMSLDHIHCYSSDSSFVDGHVHRLSGTTGLGDAAGLSHVHHYQGVTNLEDGHVHYYEGTTGPAVYLAGEGHSHQYYGYTSIDDQHAHEYNAKTNREDVGNIFCR